MNSVGACSTFFLYKINKIKYLTMTDYEYHIYTHTHTFSLRTIEQYMCFRSKILQAPQRQWSYVICEDKLQSKLTNSDLTSVPTELDPPSSVKVLLLYVNELCGASKEAVRQDLEGSALLQFCGTLPMHLLWKFKPQFSHLSPCRTKPNSISPQ